MLDLGGAHEEVARPDAGDGGLGQEVGIAESASQASGLFDGRSVVELAEGAEGEAPTEPGAGPSVGVTGRVVRVVIDQGLVAVGGGLEGQGLEVALGGPLDVLIGAGLDPGLEPVAGEVVVVRTAEGLDGLGDPAVGQRLATGALALDQGGADHGVGEAEPPGVHLVDQSHAGQALTAVEDLALVLAGDGGDELEVEGGADQRGQRQEVGGVLGDAGEALFDHVPHRVGEGQVGEVTLVDHRLQRSARGQVVQQLAGEQRTTGALVVDATGEALDVFVIGVRSAGRDQLGHLGGLQALEAHGGRPGHVGVGQEVVEGVADLDLLGAVGAEHEDRGPFGGPHEVTQELDGRGGRPVEVLQHEDDGMGVGQSTQEVRHGLEELETGGGPRIVGAVAAGREEGTEGTGAGGHGSSQLVVGPRGFGEGHGEGLVGDGQVAVTGPGEHGRALGVGPIGDLRDQSGLPDPGRSRQEHRGERAGAGLAPAVQGPSQLVGPAHQGESAVHRHRPGEEAGRRIARRVEDPDHGHGLVEALELEGSDLLEVGRDPPLGQAAGQVGGEDLARRGEGLESGGLDDGDAMGLVALHDDLAGADPDADLEGTDRVIALAIGRHRPLHVHRRGQCGRGGGEVGLHAVAGPAQDPSPVPGDRGAEQGVVVPAEGIGAVVAEAAAQLRGADHVGEENPAQGRLPPPVHRRTLPGGHNRGSGASR